MQYDHLSFPESVERVAQRYGIEIERTESTAKSGETGERESLYRINERVAANYHNILFGDPAGRKALDYLKSRKVKEELAQHFMVGYAPQTGSGLLDCAKKNYR
jgi:DNA primase